MCNNDKSISHATDTPTEDDFRDLVTLLRCLTPVKRALFMRSTERAMQRRPVIERTFIIAEPPPRAHILGMGSEPQVEWDWVTQEAWE